MSDTPRVLQVELQDELGVTYATGLPILTKMYFKLKDVLTGKYATVSGSSVCAYSWTDNPARFFLAGTDTSSEVTTADVAMMSGDSFSLRAINGVCAEGYAIFPWDSLATFAVVTTNKLWKITKVA